MNIRETDGDRIKGGIRERLAHDSGEKHVTGKAIYTDDMAEPAGMLHVLPVGSERAHAEIRKLDLSAVRRAEGVSAVLTSADIPGRNDWGHAGIGDDRVFSDRLVEYAGQVMFAVVADTIAHARAAASRGPAPRFQT